MIGFIKMAALSAALSYSAVTVYNLPVQKLETAVFGKYQDRIPSSNEAPASAAFRGNEPTTLEAGMTGTTKKGDRLFARVEQPMQLTTIESRKGVNTSVLTLGPQVNIARR